MGIEIARESGEVLPGLFVGCCPKSIASFKYVFCVGEKPTYHVSIGQMLVCLPINDIDRIPDETALREVADMVRKYRHHGSTLVHCSHGINRSGLLVALALIRDGMIPVEAIALLRRVRGDFMLSNKTFENWLLNQSSTQ